MFMDCDLPVALSQLIREYTLRENLQLFFFYSSYPMLLINNYQYLQSDGLDCVWNFFFHVVNISVFENTFSCNHIGSFISSTIELYPHIFSSLSILRSYALSALYLSNNPKGMAKLFNRYVPFMAYKLPINFIVLVMRENCV